MKRFMEGVELTAVAVLIFLSLIVFLQVVLRNFFETGFVWVEELSRFLLLSMVLISAPVVFFRAEHVKFDLLARKLSPGGRKIHSTILVLLLTFFYVVYIISHLKLMKNSGNVLSPSLRLPNRIFFGAGLLGALLGVAAGASRLVRLFKEGRK